MTLEIVAAVARENVIGYQGDLPWGRRLPADLKHFKSLTQGHVVVMGRKTWDSLPDQLRPLPGRANLVVTSRKIEGAKLFRTNQLSTLDASARATPVYSAKDMRWVKEALYVRFPVYVIGGARLYEQVWSVAQKLHITHVDAKLPGDTFFPVIHAGKEWNAASQPYQEPDKENAYGYWFATYERIT